MSGYLLDSYPASSTIYCLFDTFAAATGAPATISNFAVGDIVIYKNGSVTERTSTSGFALLDTDGIDFDGITGIGGISIDLSDNTDAGFYVVGGQYSVRIGPITVDGQTLNFILGTFRIVAAEGVAGKPKVDVDAFGGSAGTFSGGRPEVNTTHAAGTAWGSGAITAASIAADAITAAKIADNAIDAGAIAADAITAAKIADGAIDAATFAAGAINAAAIAADAITAAKIADGAIDAATFAAGAITASAIAADAIGASELAADAIAEIADAVWDEDATGHQTGGTFGQAIGDPGADTDTIWGLVNTNLDAAVSSRLAPTTAGRTLDVTAAGEAGIDWANIGSPTTVVNLSGTTVKTATDVETDTADIQSRLPAALTGDGLIKADTLRIGGTLQTAGDVGAKTGFALTSAYDFAKGTVAMTEAYAANGAAPTPVQAFFAMHQMLMQFSISGTSLTVKKLDNSTTAFTVTLDDATSPTSAART